MKVAGITLKYNKNTGSYFGTVKPEPYNVGRDEFKPTFRDVFVGRMYKNTPREFYYVTSSINGKMRRYRSRTWYETSVGNIYAYDKTLEGALKKWANNYRNRIYNRK